MNKEETINAVKKEAKKQAAAKHEMTPEEIELSRECFAAATMPIDFKDDDLKLGAGELDIRGLKEKNYKQMMFRLMAVQMSQTRQLTQIAVDLERLVMLVLVKLGVEASSIPNKLNKLIDDLESSTAEIQKSIKKEN